MKIEVEPKRSSRLINCGEVILVSCGFKEKSNIVTLAWHMPISQNPPLVAVSIAKSHFSHQLIKDAEEFAINIPTIELLPEVVFCGMHSGRNKNKFNESGLTAEPAKCLRYSPLIKECAGQIELALRDIKDFGDHGIFVGEVICARAEEGLFKEVWDVERAKLIFHLGGRFFTCPDKITQIS